VPENPSPTGDFGNSSNSSNSSNFNFDSVEEAAFWLQGYCELASDTLEAMKQSLLDLKMKIDSFVEQAEEGSGEVSEDQ
jgi:hypothetical protein